MKNKNKVIIGIASFFGVVAVVGAVLWFSMSSEKRNMVSFMMFGGKSYDNYKEYQVIDHNVQALAPTSFMPGVASAVDGSMNRNIVAITEMVKNENSKMLKKGMVQTTGVDDYTGWHVIADEGAKDGVNPFGPSPLSYYTAGIAANLHTQIIKAAEFKGVKLDNVKVEVLNKFRWNDMLASDGAGFLDETNTNIIIKSDVSQDVIEEIKTMAIRSWTAGEALRNETVIEPTFVVNGKNWNSYGATPGTSSSDVSMVDGMKLSSITDVPQKPEYLKLGMEGDVAEGFSFETMSNLKFEIFAISESAGNSERPFLQKIILSTPTPETWEMYSDEFMSEDDKPFAPTSLEYFTVGTALCLTSQTTLVSAMMGLDFTDYRIENQIDYRQENVNSTDMAGYADVAHSYVLIESDESQERLETFYKKSLSLCFAGEGLKGATKMHTVWYLNGKVAK